MAGDKVHCHEPLAEGHLGVLEYRAYKRREAVFAMVTGKSATLAAFTMVAVMLSNGVLQRLSDICLQASDEV